MQLKKMFMCLFAACMVASCTNDDFATNDVANDEGKCFLKFKVKSFGMSEDMQTRATLVPCNNSPYDFDFEEGDLFGVCSLDGTFNAAYPIASVVRDEGGDKVVSLDISRFLYNLRGKECVAYYPLCMC